jgi:hypothetical protein
MRLSRRKLVLVGALALVTLLFAIDYLSDYSKSYVCSQRAVFQAQGIHQACEAYRNDPANPDKKLPNTLTDLIRPSFGDRSFLRNGEADLHDPWGHPFRYAVVRNLNGEQEVYVWSERAGNGGLILVGAKRQANGEIELFGSE